MTFVSDAQRKHFFANNGGGGGGSAVPSFPNVDGPAAGPRSDNPMPRMSTEESAAVRNYNGFGGGVPSFPAIDSDDLSRLNRQRNDDRIYSRDYDLIRAGEGASKDAMAAYFRSADVEAMNEQEDSYKRMWRGKD